MNATKKLGEYGEDAAKRFLQRKKYTILAANWRFRHLELDIVAQDENDLVFVEVKTRMSQEMGAPEEAVSLVKQRKIIQAAHHYMEEHQLEMNVRFDIIAVSITNKQMHIRHLEAAFFPLAR
jgi:putative endonuclease